jgi:formylglycine-generating enzyme required for sulfatase activity
MTQEGERMDRRGVARMRPLPGRLAPWLVFLAVAACSSEGTRPKDEAVPGRVTDLQVADVDDTTVTLAWTAPGDDGGAGIAAEYEIRWLNTPFSEPDWVSGTVVGPAPAPVAGGEPQSARVRGVPPGQLRFFALRTRDDAGNWSLVSNTVSAQTGAPVCRLEPDTLDFGAGPPGFPFDRTFVIRNLGGGTLRGTIAPGCSPFTVTTGGLVALRAGGSLTVTVRFLPSGEGVFDCELPTGTVCGAVVCRGRGLVSTTEMIAIPVGGGETFRMGSPPDEAGRDPVDERRHEVRLTRSFRVAEREVTQAEWYAVMEWNESAHGGADRPVEQITWFDALEYCNRLSERAGRQPVYDMGEVTRDGNHIVSAQVVWAAARDGYRLLTEAEWEYVCRAGSEGAFYAGGITRLACTPLDPVLDPIGWYCGNSPDGTRPTRTRAPNAAGLYDTHGNVFEWCWDWYDPEYGLEFPDPPEEPPPAVNPYGPDAGSSRLCRGGSWAVNPQNCRSAYRLYHLPGNAYPDVGLRVVRPLE